MLGDFEFYRHIAERIKPFVFNLDQDTNMYKSYLFYVLH